MPENIRCLVISVPKVVQLGCQRTLIGVLLIMLSTANPLLSQVSKLLGELEFMPQVEVTLDHPPGLGLTIDRVAFAESTGECSDEFLNVLIENFVNNEVEVVERARLDEVLEEINFSASGIIRSEDALAMGEMLGASALIFADVQRCSCERNRSVKRGTNLKGEPISVYYAKTEVSFKGSVKVVDLASGRIFSAQIIEKTEYKEASSSSGYPEYPSEYEIQNSVIDAAREEVHRMFFPWAERRKLRYFKDPKCNLKAAYQLLRIGDLEGAAQQSEQNLDACRANSKTKPKTMARAYYNVGMSYFLRGEHDQALEHFENAYRLKAGSRIRETILECKRAKQAAQKMQRFEDRMERLSSKADLISPVAADHKAPRVDPAQSLNSRPEASLAERLQKLEELHEQGLLKDAEYQEKRKEILEEL